MKPTPAKTWVLASRNAKKATELRAILAAHGIELLGLDAFADIAEVEETGATFAANAILKAEAIRDATGHPALADDSGLCVDALDGAPGVFSARYAGATGPDRAAVDLANNEKLLRELAGVPAEARGAGFRCAVALARPDGETLVFEGETRGRMLAAPSGAGGFGYDPLFLSDDLGVSFADANAADKHRVSHRGRALAALAAWLAEQSRGCFPTDEQ